LSPWGKIKESHRFITQCHTAGADEFVVIVDYGTVKSRPLAALVDKPQAQIMCQKPGKTLIPIDKPQLYCNARYVSAEDSERHRDVSSTHYVGLYFDNIYGGPKK